MSMKQNLKNFLKRIHFNSYRAVFGIDSSKLAIGETTMINRFPNWTLMDTRLSDINLNVEKIPYRIPVKDIKMCYSAHMFEHISDDAAQYLLKQVFEVMKDGGIIRIEVPDCDKVLNDYRENKGRPIANYMAKSNNVEEHIGTLGVISNVLRKNSQGEYAQTPVYAPLETFESKLKELSNEEFCKWAINLQTKEEKLSQGHVNYWNEKKMTEFLRNAGFSDVIEVRSGFSPNKFDLSVERPHRGFYSLIVEATRPVKK